MLLRMTDEPGDYEGPWPSEDAMTKPTVDSVMRMIYDNDEARAKIRAAIESLIAAPAAPQQAEPVLKATLSMDGKQAEPDAFIHKVRVLNGEPGETDYALSFAADSFPLGDAGLFESIEHRPLYRHPTAAEVQRLVEASRAVASAVYVREYMPAIAELRAALDATG